jgi:hypothetical protein
MTLDDLRRIALSMPGVVLGGGKPISRGTKDIRHHGRTKRFNNLGQAYA